MIRSADDKKWHNVNVSSMAGGNLDESKLITLCGVTLHGKALAKLPHFDKVGGPGGDMSQVCPKCRELGVKPDDKVAISLHVDKIVADVKACLLAAQGNPDHTCHDCGTPKLMNPFTLSKRYDIDLRSDVWEVTGWNYGPPDAESWVRVSGRTFSFELCPPCASKRGLS